MILLTGDYRDWDVSAAGTALTVGVYDGVHRGHLAVLRRLRELAATRDDISTAVVTFDRHPLETIAPERSPAELTPRRQKLIQLDAAGADIVAVLDFDSIQDLTAEDFAAAVLATALRARFVAVGADFRFGRERSGGIDDLERFGSALGFDVITVPLIGGTTPVSSTAIRRLLLDGDVAAAAADLGRPYRLRGRVVAGEGRGAPLGFATANLAPVSRALIPARGVYAVRGIIDGVSHPAVVNIGTRPTFGASDTTVEMHLLDWQGDIYGSELEIDFVARLRDESRFAGMEELRAQISVDIERARRALVSHP
jgi:riboflavin kinase/FMN adenylyltransferase